MDNVDKTNLKEVCILFDLSRRQRQVADLLAIGLTTKEIASELGLSKYTCDEHIAYLCRKVGAVNRVQLVALLFSTRAEEN